ncbi:MAG: LysM peptidoglycan-binding domain-containing protein [Chloroflexi bacterium]|nr:LysM peptidoglycan-binding domain-containing protein [Chloroflexota bacterium]
MNILRPFLFFFGIGLVILGVIGFTSAVNVELENTLTSIVTAIYQPAPNTLIPTESALSPPPANDTAVPTQTPQPTATASSATDDKIAGNIPPMPLSPPYYSGRPIKIGEHIVRSGDTLFCIGRAYNVRPYAIARYNIISENSYLHPGQKLYIPNATWRNNIPGEICEPQFQSPYVPTPTPAASASEQAVNDEQTVSENAEQAPDAPISSPTPITETRKILVDVPSKMTLDESLEVILTFDPETDEADFTINEPSESTVKSPPGSERVVSPSAFGDIRHYDDYILYASARLDAPGFEISNATVEKRIVHIGEKVVFRWSVKPKEGEYQTLIVSLWLNYEPKQPDMPPLSEGRYWSDAFIVEVRQTLYGKTILLEKIFSVVKGGAGAFSVILALFQPWARKENGNNTTAAFPT